MNPWKPGVALLPLLAVSGCLSSSGPAWLESNQIEMRDYRRVPVMVLPVEITPPYDLGEGERRDIQAQVKNNFEYVFDLKEVSAPTSIQRDRIYPYDLMELNDIGQLYNVAGVVAISVVSLARESPDPRSENKRMGMRVTFTDAKDSARSWSISREYRSKSGFDTASNRFELTVREDLLQVRDELRSKYGAKGDIKKVVTFGIMGSGNPEKPRVTVSIPVLGSQFAVNQADQKAGSVTEKSLLTFRILAEDVTGLRNTIVGNAKTRFHTNLDYSFSDAKESELPRRIEETVSVPLAVGENVVEFLTYNRGNIERRNVLQVRREAREFVYTLGVGIAQYERFGESPVNSGDLKQRFEARARAAGSKPENVIFLEGRDATHDAIEDGLYNIGSLAQQNDKGLGLFYFAGKVQAASDGVYLVAYDSDPKYVEVTGIGTDDILHWCNGNCRTILDLCESSPFTRAKLSEALVDAQISYDSCVPGQNRNADNLRDELEKGLTPKAAVQEVIKK